MLTTYALRPIDFRKETPGETPDPASDPDPDPTTTPRVSKNKGQPHQARLPFCHELY